MKTEDLLKAMAEQHITVEAHHELSLFDLMMVTEYVIQKNISSLQSEVGAQIIKSPQDPHIRYQIFKGKSSEFHTVDFVVMRPELFSNLAMYLICKDAEEKSEGVPQHQHNGSPQQDRGVDDGDSENEGGGADTPEQEPKAETRKH